MGDSSLNSLNRNHPSSFSLRSLSPSPRGLLLPKILSKILPKIPQKILPKRLPRILFSPTGWWTLWAGTLLLKILLALSMPLFMDEYYYWVWGQNLQWSYFDHPPFVALLLSLGDLLFGQTNGIRLPGVLLNHLSLCFWYYLLKDKISLSRQVLFLLLMVLHPFTMGIVTTPDIPLMFFWSLSLFLSLKALQPSPKNTLNYALLGLSLGLGFCSKYNMVLFPLGLLIYLNKEKLWSQMQVSWKKASLLILMGLFASSPVLIYNQQTQWESFSFQLQHGFNSSPGILSYLLGQIFLLLPILYPLLKTSLNTPFKRFLAYLSWTPLLFFLFSGFFAPVEANWTGMVYPSLFAIACFTSISIKSFSASSLTYWGVLYGIFITLLALNLLPDPNQQFQKTKNWAPLVQWAQAYQPLYTSHYQTASYLRFHTQKQKPLPICKLAGMKRRKDQFDFMESCQEKYIPSTFYLIYWLPSGAKWPSSKSQLPERFTKNPTYYQIELIDKGPTDKGPQSDNMILLKITSLTSSKTSATSTTSATSAAPTTSKTLKDTKDLKGPKDVKNSKDLKDLKGPKDVKDSAIPKIPKIPETSPTPETLKK